MRLPCVPPLGLCKKKNTQRLEGPAAVKEGMGSHFTSIEVGGFATTYT